MIAGIYARKSTAQDGADADARSVNRQIENARTFATAKGWQIAAGHIYADDAVSGADTGKLVNRQRLLDAVSGRPPFDVLIMRDASRFSRRDGDEAFGELKRLAQAGIAIWFYQDATPFAYGTFGENVVGFVRAEMNAEFRRSIAKWTSEAMMKKAQAGFATGGRCFGFDTVRVNGHVERVINPAEAAVVRQMFEWAARGDGLKTIAKALNAAHAATPRAQQGRPRGWTPSTVRSILHRSAYHGVMQWNRSKKRGADGEQRQRPRAEWIATPAEGLRVVDERLWAAVHDRLRARQAPAALAPPLVTGRGVRRRYFLTGFGRCGGCGGSMMAVSRYVSALRTPHDQLSASVISWTESRHEHAWTGRPLTPDEALGGEARELKAAIAAAKKGRLSPGAAEAIGVTAKARKAVESATSIRIGRHRVEKQVTYGWKDLVR